MAETLAILNGYRPFIINASEERSSKLLLKKIFNQLEYNTTFKHCLVCDREMYQKMGKDYDKNVKETKSFHVCLKNPPLVILDEVDGIHRSGAESLIDKIVQKLYLTKKVLFNLYISFYIVIVIHNKIILLICIYSIILYSKTKCN